MTAIAEALKKEHLSDKKEYWQNELKSLGIEPRRQNDLKDKAELSERLLSVRSRGGIGRNHQRSLFPRLQNGI